MNDTSNQPDPVDHAWVHERIAASLAGGLSAAEQAQFDSHINRCAECFDDFTEARDADRGMQRALAGLVPGAGFEERLLETFREKTMHKRLRPIVRRAGMAIAAAVALAATGVFAQYVVQRDSVTGPLAQRVAADARAHGITLPYLPVGNHPESDRSDAGTNLRGILKSNVVYSSDFDYPDSTVAVVDRPGVKKTGGQGGGGHVQHGDKAVDAFFLSPGEASITQDRITASRVTAELQKNKEAVYQRSGQETGQGAQQQNFVSNFNDTLKGDIANKPNYYLNFNGGIRTSGGESKYGFVEGGHSYYKPTPEIAARTTVAALTDREHIIPYDIAMVPVANVATGTRDGIEESRPASKSDDTPQIADASDPNRPNHSTATTQPGTSSPSHPTASVAETAQRKIIRNGEVEFEVRSFDDASVTISAVVTEEGGFVSSTSSEKLANGKIRGTVVVRVPPERLDRTLLKLRALGDLKTQQISANDVTKQYTDIDSELRALRAMESRLIDLIKNGKGEVKELVVAEKQLGEYRVRIEKLEGEMRYYNNLVGMATLSIVAYEKDIQKPTAASEQENVTLSVETEDVEAKYKDARKILDDAKGRIVESELKKYDADQYSARIVVDVPPDKADFVTVQLKQIGRVGNYTRDRKQTTTGGTGVPTVNVEQKDTRFVFSLYNLANIAPRETAVMTIAVPDVEATYRKVISAVRQPVAAASQPAEAKAQDSGLRAIKGRVVTSNINGQQPQQMTADIGADVRAESADAMLQMIRESGEVLTSTSSENADTANTTSAKRGIQLRIVNVAAVPARESHTLRAVAADVPESYNKLVAELQSPANAAAVRIMTLQLNETDPRTVSARLSFEARREALPAVSKAFADAGIDFLSRNIVRSSDVANTLDSKVYFQIDELIAADSLAPRRTTVLGVEVDDVEKAMGALRAKLSPRAVRELEYSLSKESSGRVTGHLVVETPVGNAMAVLMNIKDVGGVEKVNQVMKNAQVPDAPFARERIDLTLTSSPAIVESGNGVGATIRAALGSSATALLYSLYYLLTGILFIGPFVLIVWLPWRLLRRRRQTVVP